MEGPREDWGEALSSLPVSSSVKILLLVGPEGDFSPEEIQQASGAGARLVSLGPLVLRCETAVVAGLATLFFLLRNE